MKRMVLAVALAVAGMASAAKVASVSVKAADGDGEDVGDAAARCQVKVGDEYDPAQCARDVRALRDAGTFDDIVVKAEQGLNGVDVPYVVKHKMRFQGPLAVKAMRTARRRSPPPPAASAASTRRSSSPT